MPDAAHRVRLEGIDLDVAFPSLRLLSTFRMALQPAKILLALLLLLLVYFGGAALDLLWGMQPATAGVSDTPYRVFSTVLYGELSAFSDLIRAAARLDFGVGAVAGGAVSGGSAGVLGALHRMVVGVPGWAWSNHPGFFVLLTGWGLGLSMIFGGGIARLATVEACHGQTLDLPDAARFVKTRVLWLLLAPVIPLAVVGVVWVGLAAAGGVFFSLPGLNLVGGLLYGVMLLFGLAAAALLVFTGLGAGMLPASVAVEGTDAFDAVSRVFTFLICRTLRFFGLSAVVLVYGALTTVLVGVVVFAAMWFTRAAVGAWTHGLADAVPGGNFGRLPGAAIDVESGGTAQASAWMVGVWARLAFGAWVAYAVSYFFTSQVWIYLLLRREVDGTAIEEAWTPEPLAEVVVEKVEPVPAAPSPPDAPETRNGDDAG